MFSTVVTNPTGAARKYVWAGKRGVWVNGGESVTLEYEPYSCASTQMKRQLKHDLEAGVVSLAYLTEMPVNDRVCVCKPKEEVVDTGVTEEKVKVEKTAGEVPLPHDDEERQAKQAEMDRMGFVEGTTEDVMPKPDLVLDEENVSTKLPPQETVSVEDLWENKPVDPEQTEEDALAAAEEIAKIEVEQELEADQTEEDAVAAEAEVAEIEAEEAAEAEEVVEPEAEVKADEEPEQTEEEAVAAEEEVAELEAEEAEADEEKTDTDETPDGRVGDLL